MTGGFSLVEVEIRTFKEVDLKGGTVVAALPSFGFVSTIVASYLISMLDSDQVCALESEDFPPISMVYAQKPKFPSRVYELRGARAAVFVCEMPVPKGTHRAIAKCLIQWAKAHDCARIVSLEGLPSEREEGPLTGDPRVWGVGSTDRARGELTRHGIELLQSGVISGVTGVLLNEGRWSGYDVTALMAEVRPDLPDAHAAVVLTKSLSRLMPELRVDLGPLQETSRRLEDYLNRLKGQAKPVVAETPPPSGAMYR